MIPVFNFPRLNTTDNRPRRLRRVAIRLLILGGIFLCLRTNVISKVFDLFHLDPALRARAHVMSGRIDLARGDNPAAREEFEEAIRLNPRSGDGYAGLARTEWNSNSHDRAFRNVKTAIRVDPTCAVAYYDWAAFLDDSQLPIAAIYRVKQSIEMDRADSDSWYFLGRLLYKQGMYPAAADALRRAVELRPKAIDYLRWERQAEAAAAQVQEQRASLAQQAAGHPGSAAALDLAADDLFYQGKASAAIHAYQQTLSQHPEDPRAHRQLASLLFAKGLYQDAAPHFRAWVRQAPGDAEAHDGLAMCLFEQEQYAAAIQEYQAALALDPAPETLREQTPAQARTDLQHAQQELAKDDAAAEEVKKDLPDPPDNPVALQELEVQAMDHSNFGEAVKRARQIVEIASTDAEGHRMLAEALLRSGKPEEALRVEGPILSSHLEPQAQIDAYTLVGNALQATGKPDEARQYWEKAVALDRANDAAEAEAHLSL